MPRLGLLIAAIAVALSGCGSTHAHASPPTVIGPTGSRIIIHNFAFQPAALTVGPGTTITVTNEDAATHTVTAATPHHGAFDTGDVAPGATTTFTAPGQPGTYPYICGIHQFMQGTLIVR